MDVLVTGGAGFIGSNLTQKLLKEGYSVLVLDNLDPYYPIDIKKRNIEICKKTSNEEDVDFSFVEADVRDKEKLERIFSDNDFSYVFHEAAQAGVRTSVENPQKPNKVNVEGTLNLLELSRDYGVKRFINASSSSVYGKTEYLPFDEDHPTKPVSPYGVSKLAAEHYTRVFYEIYGLSSVSLRYFTVYGPRMRPKMAISNFISRCLSGKPPIIYGDGSKTRDFTHINDITKANTKLLQTSKADGEILNIGSTGNISVEELARKVMNITGFSGDPIYDEEEKGDADHTHSSIDKARELIGYEPSIDISEGLEKFKDWYLENEWYQKLITE